MRVIIYRKNQMLQAFLITAEVTDREERLSAPDRGVSAALEFSQTTVFNDLDRIPARALTISVNQDATTRTHSIFVKGRSGISSLNITESTIKDTLQTYRSLLKEATFTAPDCQRPWPEKPNKDSEEFVRRLADLGGDLYLAHLNPRNRELSASFSLLKETHDEVISIVRLEETFAFPWAIFYDFDRPRTLFGVWSSVCFGFKPDGTPCGHDGSSRVYCLRGFWGYRHQLEERMDGAVNERINKVGSLLSAAKLRYVVDSTAEGTKDLKDSLLKLGAQETNGSGELLEMLRDDSRRPQVLLILAHLETRSKEKEPIGARIVLTRDESKRATDWLLSKELMESLNGLWTQPNTLVMLLTCASAATNPETLHDHVIAFHRANAGGIIGTECQAYSDLLARFSQDLTALMYNSKQPLGKAMMLVRRKLLEEGNPLAFVFTCVGCADLVLDS